MPKWKRKLNPLKPYLLIILMVTCMTLLMRPFGLAFDAVNIALLYLLPVLLSAVYWGLRPALFAAILGVLVFDFFFVTPVLSFTIADLRYLISFFVFLAVAILTATLAVKLKRQLRYSEQREATTAALFELSRQMSDITDIHALLENVSRQVSHTTGCDIAIYLPDERNSLVLSHSFAAQEDWGLSETEKVTAQLSFDHGEAVGYGTETLRDSQGFYLPLRTEDRVHGVLALHLKERGHLFSAEQQRMLEAIAGLAASAIARVKLEEEAKIAHLTAESERIRTAILDSVSHELRTPLAAIIGSVTGLIEGDKLFSPEDRMELLLTIRSGAHRMNRLVINLLSMVRLESGMLRLKKNWCDIEDLIGVTLAQVKDVQQERKLRVILPKELPMVRGDEVLLEQMLVNVVSNAIKYSPDGSEIVIEAYAEAEDHALTLTVSDQGIGLGSDEYGRIFEKFYRSNVSKQITGTGLGLAICKGIAELHNGTISAKPNTPQGMTVVVTLPVEKHQGGQLETNGTETEKDNFE